MDRETLPTYFAAEHARGERLELREFNFLGARYYRDVRAWRLDFGFALTHTVRGANPNLARGKGALGCTSGKIVNWLIDGW
jgi:hypothetical protein